MVQKNWTATHAERIDTFLRRELPIVLNCPVSNSKIRRFLMAGSVYINGRQCRIPAFELKKGSSIQVSIDEQKLFLKRNLTT
ncbi:MAG: hypothetical protein IJ828_07110 [Treponema sp.]|nr:hypothetical protein [Treponema sp.]